MSAPSARPFPATLFCPATTCACEHVSVQVGEGGVVQGGPQECLRFHPDTVCFV